MTSSLEGTLQSQWATCNYLEADGSQRVWGYFVGGGAIQYHAFDGDNISTVKLNFIILLACDRFARVLVLAYCTCGAALRVPVGNALLR